MSVGEPGRTRRWSRGVTLYTAAIAAVGLGATAATWAVSPPSDTVRLLILLGLGILSVLLRDQDPSARVTFSFLSIIVVASTVLVGPAGSAVVGALSMAFERGNRPLMVRVFNSGMFALQGLAGGWVYLRLLGPQDPSTLQDPLLLLLRVGLPLMAADVAQMLVNAVVLSGVVRLSSGVPPRRFIVQIITNSGIAYIGYGFIGFLFVVLWLPAKVGAFSAVLILAPLMVARWAFVQFGDEQRAHERALSALVTAVETKDPLATGHSARIAQLAEWMAAPLAMGAQEAQALRFSAMLHDVGKVGVPTRVLRGRHRPDLDELAALTRHPELGVDLVRQIDFLAQSLDGIRHHHERWDGLGYPAGLAGDDIPLASRVIAVADAFDALTTSRPGRSALSTDQALAEIRSRQGRQFDPWVVEALGAALERHTWAAASAPEDELTARRDYVDHDDPVVWEQVWTPRPTAAAAPDGPTSSGAPEGPDGWVPPEAPRDPSRDQPPDLAHPSRPPLTHAGPP